MTEDELQEISKKSTGYEYFMLIDVIEYKKKPTQKDLVLINLIKERK